MNKNFEYIIQESNVNFHTWLIVADGFTSPKNKEIIGDYMHEAVMYFENDNGKWAADWDLWVRLGELVLEKVKVKKLDIDDLTTRHYQVGNEVFKLADEIDSQDIQKLSLDEIAQYLKKLWRLGTEISFHGSQPIFSDAEHGALTNFLVGVLTDKGLSQAEAAQKFGILATMNKPTLVWEEKLNLLKGANQYQNIQDYIDSEIFAEHLTKYFWVNFGYVGPVWEKADFQNRVKHFEKEAGNIKSALAEHENSLSELKKQQESIETGLQLSDDEKYYFRIAREFMYLKAYRTDARHRVNYEIEKIFSELAKRFFVPLHTFRYATYEEILQMIKAEKVENSEKYLNRRKRMLHITKDGVGEFVPTEETDKTLSKYVADKQIENTNEVKGQIAYSGKVSGKAKIVQNPADMAKVNEGDILIATSTNPDVLPAMAKASAFVTDQGGITSHAAIVSREMKKPCVIGTKIATKIFKDGDMVEVDAENGIVTIINRDTNES